MFELITDSAKLALIVAFVYLGLHLYGQRSGAAWTTALIRRRIAVLLVIALAATGIKVFEDVLGRESGLFDEVVLKVVREHTPSALMGFFASVTATGSFQFMFPIVAVATLSLMVAKRWFDALLVALSPALAAALVFAIKLVVARARPVLGTDASLDSSFPSGHTVAVAAFATATALVSIGIWPKSRAVVSSIAVAWIVLVALSRLILGVHWPTDVLAAACLGAAIPLLLSLLASARAAR